MNARERARFVKLRDALRRDKQIRSHWDFDLIANDILENQGIFHCDSRGCAMGMMAFVFPRTHKLEAGDIVWKDDKGKEHLDPVADFFGITDGEKESLFCTGVGSAKVLPQDVAKRMTVVLRAYDKGKGEKDLDLEDNWN